MLQVIPGWLKAARLSFEWLDMDESGPLRALHQHLASLLSAAEAMPDRGCEIAQQLARWVRCDVELKPLLRPLLDRLLPLAKSGPACPQLLPLLADLASDRWPRVCLEDPEVGGMLDVLCTADAALLLVRNIAGEEDSASNAEAALAVWQTLAGTAMCGTMEWEDEAELGAGRHSEWWVPSQQVFSCPAFPGLFARLVPELLRLLQCPSMHEHPKPEAVVQVRAAAQTAIAAWAALMGETTAWVEATWTPLQNIKQRLSAERPSETLAKDVEVTLWFSYTLAASWPERSAPAAAVVLEIGDRLDGFPPPWRSLLWMQACCLASTGPSHLSTRLIEWMLQRPPQLADAPALLGMTELPYASSLEMACRQLPPTAAFAMAAERLLGLALAEIPANQHPQSAEAKARMLRAMSHVMGGDAAQLCEALRRQILPSLRATAQGETGSIATRMIFSILHAVLPRKGGEPNPAISLWREYWDFVENAVLHWPCQMAADGREQPLDAAAEALAAAGSLPGLFQEVLQLLALGTSRRQKSGAEICLAALESVMQHLPSPPLDQAVASRAMAAAVCQATEAVLNEPDSLQNPMVLKALFALWSRGLAAGQAAAGLLRPSLLANCMIVDRLLGVFCEMVAVHADERMFRWLNLLLPRDGQTERHIAASILQALPSIYAAMFQALALQESLARFDGGVMDAAEFMFFSAEIFPHEYSAAVTAGLLAVPQLPTWSRQQILQLLDGRQEWPRRSAWICAFQQLVQDWQRARQPGI
ncbi:unnamed protein product [Symbiodinium natans]|uniref:Uncharacterized protein n=1 Tax=Symbiodinium natans TaxID=878477 RepID=A0A812UDM6_9DINO|nr:unnamed protein product [Symbiodinium natans]